MTERSARKCDEPDHGERKGQRLHKYLFCSIFSREVTTTLAKLQGLARSQHLDTRLCDHHGLFKLC